MMIGDRSLPNNSSTSNPSHPGIWTSRNTKSGFALLICSMASDPDPHSTIDPMSGSRRSNTVRLRRAHDSSSTTSVCIDAGRLSGGAIHVSPEWQLHDDFHSARIRMLKLQFGLFTVQDLQAGG